MVEEKKSLFYSTVILVTEVHLPYIKHTYKGKTMDKEMFPSSSIPPDLLSVLLQEMRDQLVAELLLCGAVVRSGRARRAPEVMQRVVNQLCAMRTKKSYLDITATQFLVNLMERVSVWVWF